MGYGVLGLGVALVSALLSAWWRPQLFLGLPGSPFLRLLGALVGMGLALLGAGLLVVGEVTPLAVSLALLGPVLALLGGLGGDLLWVGRGQIGRAVLVSVGLGFSAAWGIGFPALTGPLVVLAAVAGAQIGWLARNSESWTRLKGLLSHLEPWALLLVLAVLVRVPVPLWPEGFALLGPAQVVLLTLAALLWGWSRIGPRILLLAASSFSLGLGIEVLGSRTGVPFGVYSYATAPHPTLFGVPLIVPMGWFALVFSAHLLAGGRSWLTGLLVLAWDTGLEALMTAKGYWAWHDPSPLWYGAPLQNYLAWFMVGSLLSVLFSRMAPRPRDASFAWAYRLEALFIPTGLALLGLWPAALVCGLAMNLLAWPWILLVKRCPQTAA